MDEWSELPKEANPPPELERRVIAGLRRRGFLSRRRWWMQAAAAAIVLAAGFAAGFAASRLGAPRTPTSPRYLLLLRESGGPTTAAQVQEYSAWARKARAERALLSGEKLSENGRLLSPGEIADQNFDRVGEIGGFFLITAPDLETATKIAESSPHLRYGGSVELRPIDNLTESSK